MLEPSQRARELLAAEYEAIGLTDFPDALRKGARAEGNLVPVLRAIDAALALSPPSVSDGAIRAAFENARRAPYRERCEACPDSFERSPTGTAYASPHVQEAFVSFASGYRAAAMFPRDGVREEALRDLLHEISLNGDQDVSDTAIIVGNGAGDLLRRIRDALAHQPSKEDVG